ncbi:hypothetical protein VTJ83DRAFT_7093 [Remersonia thermophila]|uniref:Transmembrane protein n=1 Tax=Remersonia thermophila TaxID=72144 RepID=A0ABR4D2N5_9PEZI
MPALPAPVEILLNSGDPDHIQAPTTLQVICAFPLSGQYGAGSRVLYYVLVAACIFARRTEWLRNTCLVAALVTPAIAALHAIVLSALHVDGAVDLDIYGALHLLILAGLLALAVEFFRTEPSTCIDDHHDTPISEPSEFTYGKTTCGLNCSVENGPSSPLRRGPAENIYVVPNVDVFPYGAATLVATACCIPGVLYLVWTWTKLLDINSESLRRTNTSSGVFGQDTASDKMRLLTMIVSWAVGRVEFGSAVIAMLVVGELNFLSGPMLWEAEPVTNASQWSGMATMRRDHPALQPIPPGEWMTPTIHHWPSPATSTHELWSSSASPRASYSNNTQPGSIGNPDEPVETSSQVRRFTNILFPMAPRPRSRERHLHSSSGQAEQEEAGLSLTPGSRSRASSFCSVMSQRDSASPMGRAHSPTLFLNCIPSSMPSVPSPASLAPVTTATPQPTAPASSPQPPRVTLERSRLHISTIGAPSIVVSSEEVESDAPLTERRFSYERVNRS